MTTRLLVTPSSIRGGWVLLRSSSSSSRQLQRRARQHVSDTHAAAAASNGGGGEYDDAASSSCAVVYNEEKSYHLLGRGRGAATRVTAREHTIHMDVPKSMGGKDSAPQPVELMLAALMVSVCVRAKGGVRMFTSTCSFARFITFYNQYPPLL